MAYNKRLSWNFVLCVFLVQPLGACDYLEMARIFDTVFIRNVPMLTLTLKDQARRFTTLIDNFYDQKVCMYVCIEIFFALLLNKNLKGAKLNIT